MDTIDRYPKCRGDKRGCDLNVNEDMIDKLMLQSYSELWFDCKYGCEISMLSKVIFKSGLWSDCK
jgi:hypothetical protein